MPRTKEALDELPRKVHALVATRARRYTPEIGGNILLFALSVAQEEVARSSKNGRGSFPSVSQIAMKHAKVSPNTWHKIVAPFFVDDENVEPFQSNELGNTKSNFRELRKNRARRAPR